MGRAAVLVSVVFAFALAPAAQAQFQPRIIGGSTTTISQYPWQAAVVYDSAKVSGNPFQRQFCGGSLISPYIIVTAGHCVYRTDPDNNSDLDPDDVNVVLGQTTLSAAPPGSEFDVQGVSIQSGYDDGYGPGQGVPSNDVAYIVLQSPYNAATPIDIAGPDEGGLWDPESLEQITGWGATATSGPGSGGSDTLRHATVPIVSDSGCASSYGVYFNSSTMVCAGYPEGGIDTCYGDSGGPMQAAIGGGAYRLVGITSWGSGCAEPDAPGVYTRVADTSMRTAIASTVFNLEDTFGLPHEDIEGGDDNDPPETSIISGPSGPTNDDTPTFTFTSDEVGSTFECRFDSEPFGSCLGPSGSHTPTTALTDGPHTFEVQATDSADNTDPTPASRNFTVDTQVPAAPSITDTDPDSPANDNNPEVKGSAEAGSTVRLYESSSCGGGVEAQGPTAGFASPGLTATVADNAATSFTATATDQAGNVSGCSTAFAYTEDSTGPSPPTITSTSPTSPANDNNPEVVGTVGAGSPTQVKIYKNATCSGAPDVTGTVAQFTGAGITVSVTGDATTPLSARASDASNNDSTCSNTINYVEDSTAPPFPQITDTDPDSPSSVNALKVKGSAEAGATVRLYEASTASDCTPANLIDTDTAAVFSSPGLDATATDNSSTRFRVTATDAAGNPSGCSAGFDYLEDSTVPTDPTVSSTSHTVNVPSNDPTVAVTFSAASDGLSGVDGFSYQWSTSPITLPDMTKDAEETATGTTSPTLADGSHYFHLRTRDNAGNWTSTVHLGPFVIDSTAPDNDPPETSITSGPSGPTNDATPTFTFSSDEVGSTFQCRFDSAPFDSCLGPSGSHTPTTALTDGAHTFEVQATDTSDNTDPTPASRSFTVETAQPPALGGPADSTPPIGHVSAKWKQGATVKLQVGCDEACTVTAAGVAVANRRRIRLTTEIGEVAGGGTLILKLAPRGRKARLALLRLRAGGSKPTAKINVAFADRAGNSATERLTLKLKR